jgi:hypothetical protein
MMILMFLNRIIWQEFSYFWVVDFDIAQYRRIERRFEWDWKE